MVKENYKGLNRRIMEQTWGRFFQILDYKAEKAGGWMRKVSAKFTSQRCSNCGKLPKKKLELQDRTYSCEHCGFVEDRDLNAALNILAAKATLSCGTSTTPGGISPAGLAT